MAFLGGWRITRTGIVFVLGILVLAGLTFGGIWLAHDRGEQARRQEAAKIAEQNLEAQSQTETTSTETNSETTNPSVAETETKTETTTVASTNTAALPQTGADLSQIIIVTLLVAAGAYYLTSRRAVRQL